MWCDGYRVVPTPFIEDAVLFPLDTFGTLFENQFTVDG
jgi:hypothetical protein